MTVRNGHIREDRWVAGTPGASRARSRAAQGRRLRRWTRAAHKMSESVSSNGVSGLRPQALVWWRTERGSPPDFPRFEWELCGAGGGGARFRENNHARCRGVGVADHNSVRQARRSRGCAIFAETKRTIPHRNFKRLGWPMRKDE